MSKICTISVYVKDLKEATSFYSGVLGLKVEKEFPYLVVLENEGAKVILCQTEAASKINSRSTRSHELARTKN